MFSRNIPQNPLAHYTLFANITNREWNHFFTAQIIVRENRANMLLYTVRCSPSIFERTYLPLEISFFRQKSPLCSSKRPLPQHKSCEQCMAKEKPVCETWPTLTIHYSLYVLILSFHPCFVGCSWIMYSMLLSFRANADLGKKCKRPKKGVKCKKSYMKYPTNFSFFAFCDHFFIFCDKCVVDLRVHLTLKMNIIFFIRN